MVNHLHQMFLELCLRMQKNKLTPLTLNPSLMSAILAGNNELFKTLLHAPQMQPNNLWQLDPIVVFIVTVAAVNMNLLSPALRPGNNNLATKNKSIRDYLQTELKLQPLLINAIIANPVILALIITSPTPTSNTFGARIDIIGELKARRPDLFNKAGNDLLQLRTNNAITDEHYDKANSALATLGALAKEEDVHSMTPVKQNTYS